MADQPEVIVETNWIVDVALQQDEASVELFEHAKATRVHLFLPVFCLAEATKNIESKQADIRRVLSQDQLPKLGRELSRSPVTSRAKAPIDATLLSLATAHDAIVSAFWPVLRDIVATVTLLTPRPETIDLTGVIHDSLKLEPADASVLATAVIARRDGVCRSFMSKDGDFSEEGVQEYIAAEELTFYGSALPIVGPLRR